MDKRLIHKLATVAEQVVSGYRGGLSLRDLASLHGVAPNTIRSLLLSNGVELRKRGRRAANKMDKELVQS